MRIFCLPFSGSGASAFSAWPAAIDDAEICPVQFPSRANRLGHPHYGTYENLAVGLAEALEPLLDRPFALFGHCAGALGVVVKCQANVVREARVTDRAEPR
ncbi:thioesterase II family protein [Streptomyces sp. NPDC048305]|uniref:thioesterase II family protein n=1 Tax=Streptomyces sp. NPDC048305 TaxID=3365532 RepID=UPI0037105C27